MPFKDPTLSHGNLERAADSASPVDPNLEREVLLRQLRVYRTILSVTQDFVYIFDRSGRFVFANRPLLELFGVTFEQVVGKTFSELGYEPWHAEMHLREIATVFESKQPIRGEIPFKGGSGMSGIYDYIFSPVLDSAGEVEFVMGTTRDVTESRNAQRERDRLADLWRLALDSAKLGWWHLEAESGEAILDERTQRYFGLTRDRVPYEQVIDAIHPDDRARVSQAVAAATDSNGPHEYSIEYRVVHPSGEIRWVSASGQASFQGDGDARRFTSFVGTLADITEARKSQDALRESESQLSDVIRTALDCIIGIDHKGLVTEWNPAAERTFGYARDEVLGREMAALIIPPEFRDLHRNGLANYLVTGEGPVLNKRLELTAVRRDGSQFPIELTIHPLALSSPPAFTSFVRDITERKSAELQREQLLSSERDARAEAERASRMKDEFLATLSHELRTPLNAILGWSQIMKREGSSAEDMSQGLEVIERNARAQSQIIEDLLDMSRFISGKVRLDVQRINVPDIVQAAVETARPSAESKGVRLQCIVDPLHGVIVTGDASRLQQVLWNLLSNAIKFTPRGGRVQALLERVNSHLELSVIDTGDGIDAQFLPFVFDRFRQADASTTRRHGGLGLGLSIVKQLVHLHGGAVRVHSAGIGHGTTFVVSLPLTVLRPEADEAKRDREHPRIAASLTAPGDSGITLDGVRVLVVDDEADARELVRRLLLEARAQVTVAASAQEAVQHVSGGRFDVLVSDIGMPGDDGYALIRRVRSLPADQGGNIPAIALTAYARTHDRIKAISAGFSMHIAKPVEPAELIIMVAGAAGRTGKQSAVSVSVRGS